MHKFRPAREAWGTENKQESTVEAGAQVSPGAYAGNAHKRTLMCKGMRVSVPVCDPGNPEEVPSDRKCRRRVWGSSPGTGDKDKSPPCPTLSAPPEPGAAEGPTSGGLEALKVCFLLRDGVSGPPPTPASPPATYFSLLARRRYSPTVMAFF